jgi:FkbM family methyltransferase
MENLFYRIRRYLTYPADTNGKVVEIWQRMRSFMEDFQIRVGTLEKRLGELQKELYSLRHNLNRIESSVQTIELCDRLATPWLPLEGRLDDNPEFLLLAHLVSFFPKPVALDVGANEGALSEVLLDAGFEVYAFEPYAPAMKKLAKRLASRARLHLMEMALGSEDTTLALSIAEGGREDTGDDPSVYNTFRPHFVGKAVTFTSQVEVPVRSLSSLAAKKEVPDDFTVLKIDTEGFDLEVIRGMGQLEPQVVQTEFWGEDFLFVKDEEDKTKLVLAKQIIDEMRNRGYRWNLLMFRIEGEPAIRFTANLATAPRLSWGNLFFFKDFRIFEEAYRWTSTTLPRLQSAAFLGASPAGTHISVLPLPENSAFAGSVDCSRLGANQDAIVLFAQGQSGESDFSIKLDQPLDSRRATAYFLLGNFLAKHRVNRGFAVATTAESLITTIAVADIISVPLALILPDDRAFLQDRQMDPLIAEAIDKTKVAFTTSPALCASVQANLGKKLWFLPAWLRQEKEQTETNIPTDEQILTWIFDSLKDGFPSDDYLRQSSGGVPPDLDRTVPYAHPPSPKSLHWSIRPYFQALYRLAQIGYQPEFVVDVGASTGHWSHIASRIFPKSRFYLIEPLLERYQQQDNTIYALHPEFTNIACAVADKAGEMEFNISPDLYSSSFLDGVETSPDRHWEPAKVQVRTLDEISSTLPILGRGLLKIDVQLVEHLVLDGAARFLDQVDVICLELSLERFAPVAKTFIEMVTKLNDLGFEYFDYAGSWRNSKTGRMIQQDTVFIRRSLGY